MTEPSRKETDPAAIHARVIQHADRLFAALEDLRAIGGLGSLPLRPGSMSKAVAQLRGIRLAIDEQLGTLKAPKPPKPRPRPGGTGKPTTATEGKASVPPPEAPGSPADEKPVRRIGGKGQGG